MVSERFYPQINSHVDASFVRVLTRSYASVLLDCRRQGTVLLTQVPVTGSTASTMTKGRSSSVATVRCLSSDTGSRYEPYRGHTGYLIWRIPIS